MTRKMAKPIKLRYEESIGYHNFNFKLTTNKKQWSLNEHGVAI